MKKTLSLIAGILFSITTLMAQGEGVRQTPEERTKAAMEQMAQLKLDATATEKVTVIFNNFYTSQQKAMEEIRAAGTFDREAIRNKRTELAGERDKKLAEVLTADQLKKFKDEIEPAMRPQRRSN